MTKIEDWFHGKSTYILLLIIAGSAILRLYHINYQSLWLDELYSIIPTDPKNSLAFLIESAKNDQPPLFFIYIHSVFKIFGYNEFVGRLACAFVGIISIPAIYFLGKELHAEVTGLFAAFLVAINYFHIYYSQELRFYSLAFLFSVLSYLFFIRAFQKNNRLDYGFYSLFTICLLYTHYYGLVIFCTQVLTFFFLLTYKRDSDFIINSMIAGFTVCIAFVPWMPVIIREAAVNTTWMKRPGPFFLAEYFYDYTGKEVLTTVILISLLSLFIKSSYKTYVDTGKIKAVYVIVLLWIFASYLLPYIRSVISTPMLHPRYTIVILPAWLLLCSIAWTDMMNTKFKSAISILLVLGFLINMVFFKQHYSRIEKTQFREASELVKSNNPAHYPIYSSLAWHFNFYFRNDAEKVRDLRMDELSSHEYIWLLQAHNPAPEMQKEISRLSENYEIIDQYSLFEADAILLKQRK